MFIPRRLVALLIISALTLLLGGCNAYMLQGKVVRGSTSGIQLVYAGDEQLNQPGVPGVDVRITRDPTTLNRHLVGKSRTSGAGEFTLIMDEFGTGWMQEQWLVQAIASGHANAETLMQLPSKGSKWRLLITLAPGVSQPPQDQNEMMQDFERFK